MPRVKLSEFCAKSIISSTFDTTYEGVSIDLQADITSRLENVMYESFVVKVDQAVKKRNKLGLVKVGLDKNGAVYALKEFKKMGYRWAIAEPFVVHAPKDEKYIALERSHDGIKLSFSAMGGVDIENNSSSITSSTFDHFSFDLKLNTTGLSNQILKKLYEIFNRYHMTYLEINPAIIMSGTFLPLDAAVEVDSSAQFFVGDQWTEKDIREHAKQSEFEAAIEQLNRKSPSSFNLKVLNKDAGIFLLLSGGGASVVVADEFAAKGLHGSIANYGEYSGNPTTEETYQYTKQLLKLLSESKSSKKVLVIGGGTANFTDIAKTFTGVLQAMEEFKNTLKEQGISVFVRRGGPNYKAGLMKMKQFLEGAGIPHIVSGPELPISQLVDQAAEVMADA